MKVLKTCLSVLFFSLISFNTQASINLNIKIGQVVGSKTVETVKTISANYNQDIVIMQEGLKNRIIINLKKFKNILVNGNRINPVQIDMKVVDGTKKVIGKTQTVTSFYNNSAEFNVANNLIATADNVQLSLNFEEIN